MRPTPSTASWLRDETDSCKTSCAIWRSPCAITAAFAPSCSGASPEAGKAALVAVVSKSGRESGLDAGALLDDASKAVQGGGSKNPDMAMAGGKNIDGIDEALNLARAAAGVA